jgi:glutamate N-acetyltransferase/amino-acid N-acetyltransferase
MHYPDSSTYRERLRRDAALPAGFQCSVASLKFVPAEKPDAGEKPMNLALIRLDEPSPAFGAVFTRNAFPGWPVIAGRELTGAAEVQGVLVNNKVANVGAANGLEASLRLTSSAAAVMGDQAPYIPSSTGVIGWSLPVEAMERALPELKGGLQSGSLLPFAEAIMTTDAWPKVRGARCGEGRITAAAKGAGMIEPNMATMLAFFLTDIDVPRDLLRAILAEEADESFNRISIDGETSTSDTVLLLSSRKRPFPGEGAFRSALRETARALAEDVVRNGEGTAHVFRVTVNGAPDRETAVRLARAVVNAPLTKTAVRGNDPNVGRVLQALGSACGRMSLGLPRERLAMDIGGIRVFGGGVFRLDGAGERSLNSYFKSKELPIPSPGWPRHEERVEIELHIGLGDSSASVTGSDLSEEYVKINADYRT